MLRLMTRQEGSGSPHASQSGGVKKRMADQQRAQTAPCVGWSSAAPQAAQEGDRRTERTASKNLDVHRFGVTP